MQPTRVSYAASAAKGLAITQLVLGVICLIVGIIAVALMPWLTYRTGAMEVWIPILFIVAGILGIVAASQGTTGIIVAHMVLSILASVFAFSLFVNACIYARVFGTHIAISIFSFAELVIAIISSAFCCRAVCCRTSTGHGVVLAAQPQGATVVVTSGQPVVYHQQQVAQPGMQYAPPGQYVVQSGVQQQMPPQQYGYDQYPAQYPTGQHPAQYPQAGGQAPIETKPPMY